MKLDELLAQAPAQNLNKLYVDMFDGDAAAANAALQNDLKLKTPLASIVGKKPKKPVNPNNLRVNLQNAQRELQSSNLHQQAMNNIAQVKKEHGIV